MLAETRNAIGGAANMAAASDVRADNNRGFSGEQLVTTSQQFPLEVPPWRSFNDLRGGAANC